MLPNPFTFTRLSSKLVLITWLKTPDNQAEEAYLHQLGEILDQAEHPLYFISDIRKGRIIGMRAIQRLSAFTSHKNWAGSTAFSSDPITALLVRSFRSFATKVNSRNEMQTTPETALSFLETLKPAITEDVDWDTVIGKPATDTPTPEVPPSDPA